MEKLKILDFAVIIRNIIDLGKIHKFEKNKVDDILSLFKEIFPEKTEHFEISNYVFQRVCTLAKEDMIRMELPSIQLIDEKKIYLWEDEKIIKKFKETTPYEINIFPTLHKTGVVMINMHVHFNREDGYSVDEAIHLTRLNLRTVAIKIPDILVKDLELSQNEERFKWIKHDEGTFLVGSLKDFSSELIRPLFHKVLKKKYELETIRDYRCISSTLIQIYKTNPECKAIDDFVELDQYGKEIRGLGSLDKSYYSRTDASIYDSFCNNLSSDEEAGVFTFGLSDLILFDSSFDIVVEDTFKRRKITDKYSAVIYNSSHYSCLLEWVYLEKYIIDLYSRKLSKAIAQEDATPEQMLSIQKQSMHDLIAYKAGITPYPSREEFLEKARNSHNIPEMQEKLEKKRDLATDYVIQEYTLRTNKSLQLLNIFISATATFGLMEVILTIAQGKENKTFWSFATLGLFAIMIFILWGINRVLMSIKNRKLGRKGK